MEELDGILSRADSMERTIGAERVKSLRGKRDLVLCAMKKSEEAGCVFSKLWGRLGDDLCAALDEPALNGHLGPDDAEHFARRVADYWSDLASADGSLEE